MSKKARHTLHFAAVAAVVALVAWRGVTLSSLPSAPTSSPTESNDATPSPALTKSPVPWQGQEMRFRVKCNGGCTSLSNYYIDYESIPTGGARWRAVLCDSRIAEDQKTYAMPTRYFADSGEVSRSRWSAMLDELAKGGHYTGRVTFANETMSYDLRFDHEKKLTEPGSSAPMFTALWTMGPAEKSYRALLAQAASTSWKGIPTPTEFEITPAVQYLRGESQFDHPWPPKAPGQW